MVVKNTDEFIHLFYLSGYYLIMRKPLAILCTVLIALIVHSLVIVQANASEDTKRILEKEQQAVGTNYFTASNYKPGIIQHIVLFKYKKSVTEGQITEIRKRFINLKSGAKRNGHPYIERLEAGEQNSGENAHEGFRDAFVVTFQSEGDRNYYVGTPVVNDPKFYDPSHQEFKVFVGQFLAEKNGVLVFDFKTQTEY